MGVCTMSQSPSPLLASSCHPDKPTAHPRSLMKCLRRYLLKFLGIMPERGAQVLLPGAHSGGPGPRITVCDPNHRDAPGRDRRAALASHAGCLSLLPLSLSLTASRWVGHVWLG